MYVCNYNTWESAYTYGFPSIGQRGVPRHIKNRYNSLSFLFLFDAKIKKYNEY
jgi:hypothetical protein